MTVLGTVGERPCDAQPTDIFLRDLVKRAVPRVRVVVCLAAPLAWRIVGREVRSRPGRLEGSGRWRASRDARPASGDQGNDDDRGEKSARMRPTERLLTAAYRGRR